MTVDDEPLTKTRKGVLKALLEPIDFKNQFNRLLDLLCKYHVAIALSDNELGTCRLFKHEIRLEPNSRIIHKRPYRSPHAYREIVNKEIAKLKNQGVIEESNSPWSAPLLLIKKKDGSYRVVVDYRELNSITIPDRYPIPSINEALSSLRNAKIFSSIDLKSGFFQIDMHENSKEYTAFATHDGHYHFNKMAMGLRNSPCTFQRCLNSVLSGLGTVGVLLYLDDLLLYSECVEDHFYLLEKVLDKLKKTGLKINLKKCKFFRTQVLHLGHLITSQGIRPDPDKLEKLPDWPKPTTLKTLKSFLGYASYFRSYLQNFAEHSRPLYDLTKLNNKFIWTESCDKAFNSIKEKLRVAQMLHYPNYSKEFLVVTDASSTALGAVLMQRDDHTQKILPIEYASKTLNSAQSKYSVTDLEAHAVDFGLKKFRYQIAGYPIRVICDHKPLLGLFKTKNLNDVSARMARLIIRVQSYDPKISYIRGDSNNLADFLSRLPANAKAITSDINVITELDEKVEYFTFVELIEEQRTDKLYGKIIHKLINKIPLDKSENVTDKKFIICDDLLYCKDSDNVGQLRYRPVIPANLENRIIGIMHHSYPYIHPSVDKTVANVTRRYFFKNISSKVKNYIEQCVVCQRFKGIPHPPCPYDKYPIPKVPFSTLHMDFLGPLTTTDNNNKYVLVIIDYTTRFIILEALPNRKSDNVALILFKRVIMPFSAPKVLVSDNALEFTCGVVKAICKLYGTSKIEITTRTPHANGVVERSNQNIVNILKILINDSQTNWDDQLFICESAINAAYNQSLGDSPHFAVYGFDKRTPFDNLLSNKNVGLYNVEDIPSSLYRIHTKVLQKVNTTLRSSQDKYLRKSRSRTKERKIKVGDRVFILEVPKPNLSKKLCPTWKGPYRVIKKLPFNRVEIKSVALPDSTPFKIHVNRTKVVIQRDADPNLIPSARDVFPKRAVEPENIDDVDSEPEDIVVMTKPTLVRSVSQELALDPTVIPNWNDQPQAWSPRKSRSQGGATVRQIPDNSRI